MATGETKQQKPNNIKTKCAKKYHKSRQNKWIRASFKLESAKNRNKSWKQVKNSECQNGKRWERKQLDKINEKRQISKRKELTTIIKWKQGKKQRLSKWKALTTIINSENKRKNREYQNGKRWQPQYSDKTSEKQPLIALNIVRKSEYLSQSKREPLK